MNLTKEQQFYIALNNEIKNKRFKNYYDALKKLNQLLENGDLHYEDYWTLVARANEVYNKEEHTMKNIEQAVERLNIEFGGGVKLVKHYKLHNEDEWNNYDITYNNIIVGSELVDYDFVRQNIINIINNN